MRRAGVSFLSTSVTAVLMLSACGGGSNGQQSGSLARPGSSTSAAASSGAPSTPSAPSPECRDASRFCLGVLQPGTYRSAHLDVFSTGKPGQLSYSVGPGWANTLDHQPSYWIRPQQAYLAADWQTSTSGIYVWTNVAAAKQVNTCPEESETNVKTGAASIAAWLSGLPGLSITKRDPITIDGRQAIVLDVHTSGPKALCDPDAPLLANRPGAPDPWVNGINISEAQRLMLFDLPGGHTAEVVVAGPKADLDTLLARAAPVIASMHFAL